MNECAVPIGASAIACVIAGQIDNDEDLSLLAAVLVQIADTLATIAAQRARLNKVKIVPR